MTLRQSIKEAFAGVLVTSRTYQACFSNSQWNLWHITQVAGRFCCLSRFHIHDWRWVAAATLMSGHVGRNTPVATEESARFCKLPAATGARNKRPAILLEDTNNLLPIGVGVEDESVKISY